MIVDIAEGRRDCGWGRQCLVGKIAGIDGGIVAPGAAVSPD